MLQKSPTTWGPLAQGVLVWVLEMLCRGPGGTLIGPLGGIRTALVDVGCVDEVNRIWPNQRARQDLNLRPFGPEADPVCCRLLRPGSILSVCGQSGVA
jgi:hypothetical protein